MSAFREPEKILGVSAVQLDQVVTDEGVDLLAMRPPGGGPGAGWGECG